MCDTIAALPPSTSGGLAIFGKNSDREPDEAQNIDSIPGRQHPPGATVKCTYIEIPEVQRTYSTLLCRPFWMWGAEMGLNENGVAIGNEAIFTRMKPERTGLTGMDLLRLALERSCCAKEALDTIIGLLEEHGQGGNCGYRHGFRYMNGFLVIDRKEGYVLETAGRMWAWKAIQGVAAISNIISITDDYDSVSPDLTAYATDRGWCSRRKAFNFRKSYSDTLFTWGGRGERRLERTRSLLHGSEGKLDPAAFAAILRDHGADSDGGRPLGRVSVCMHASEPLIRRSQTTNSMIAVIGDGGIRSAATGASSPCLNPFLPLPPPGESMPSGYIPASAGFDPESHWWRRELIHRTLLMSGKAGAGLPETAAILSEWERRCWLPDDGGGDSSGGAFRENCFRESGEIVKKVSSVKSGFQKIPLPWYSRIFWRRLNRLNGIQPAA